MPNMALKASLILSGIAIGLLVIYGADVAVGQGTGEGFLGSDTKARGIGLGLPSVILPITAYFISRKESSKPLGVLIIIAGILVVIGGGFALAMADLVEAEAAGTPIVAETVGLIVIGAFIVALGSIKLKQ